jgi:hypothetical protein
MIGSRTTFLFAAFLLPYLSLAQNSVRKVEVSSKASCPKCSIEATKSVSLTSTALKACPVSVLRDSRGQIHLLPVFMPPVTFDSKGRELRSVIAGKGPGEALGPTGIVVGPGDSLHLFDAILSRHSVYAPDGKFIRSIPYAMRMGTAFRLLPNGSALVMAVNYMGPSGGQATLEEIDTTGKVTGAYALNPSSAPMGQAMRALQRAISLRKGGGVWAVRSGTYVIEGYGPKKAKDIELTRKPDWFVVLPKEVNGLGDETHAPASEVVDVRQDSKGRLWTATLVPSEGWKAARGKVSVETDPRGVKVSNYPNADLGAMFDTMLEVIDPATGRLITSKKLRAWARYVLDDGYVASCRYEGRGAFVDVWRVRVVGE